MSYFSVMMFFAAVPGILITWFILQRLTLRLSPYIIISYRQFFALMCLLYGLRIKIVVGFGVLLIALTAFLYSKHNYSVQISALKSECRDRQMAERTANIAKRNKAKKEELEARLIVLERLNLQTTNSFSVFKTNIEITKIENALKSKPHLLWKLDDALSLWEPSHPMTVSDYEYFKRFSDIYFPVKCNLPEYSFFRYAWSPRE